MFNGMQPLMVEMIQYNKYRSEDPELIIRVINFELGMRLSFNLLNV